ncbi:hypothetical protein [Wolbachia endosymbiont of Encarsia formosa]|uniref:hypothetical protein n=1 Tax=Wolbachia endosymbiont of Encarsia formosa TaxID=77125 RepID=UPI0031BB178E
MKGCRKLTIGLFLKGKWIDGKKGSGKSSFTTKAFTGEKYARKNVYYSSSL